MSLEFMPGALIAHMSGADVFGLIHPLIVAYLFYALIRGENL